MNSIAWAIVDKEGKPIVHTVAGSEKVSIRKFVYAVSFKRRAVSWEEMQVRGYRSEMVEIRLLLPL